MTKQVVIDMSEKVTNRIGKDPEQLLWRFLVLYALFGPEAVSMMGM